MVIAMMCLFDFVLFRHNELKARRQTVLRANVAWSGVSLLLAGLVAFWSGLDAGAAVGAVFLASKALSLGEAFIIYLVLWALRIPDVVARRFLFSALLMAMLVRVLLIAAGYRVVQEQLWWVPVFGAITLLMALQFLLRSDRPRDVTGHWAVRLIRRLAPFTENMPPRRYVVREAGRRKGTPLLLAALVIAFTVMVFGVTAFPAAFAITPDPWIGLAGGLLGLVGFRSVYYLIAKWGDFLSAVKPALTSHLGFIGVVAIAAPWVRPLPEVALGILAVIWATAFAGIWYGAHNRTERFSAR